MNTDIRQAMSDDLPRLIAIEKDAGEAFRTVGMPEIAEHDVDVAALHAAVTDGRVWVACTDGVIVGYVHGEVVDGNAHVAQVSVDPAHAGRRHGQRLVERVEAWGRERSCSATTLTTFTHVPWNAPYYARLGYTIVADADVGPQLRRVMDEEASLPGMSAARCAMVKRR